MTNEDLRKIVQVSGLKWWQVADAAGISSYTLSTWLRHELEGEKKQRVTDAIEKCIEEKERQRQAMTKIENIVSRGD